MRTSSAAVPLVEENEPGRKGNRAKEGTERPTEPGLTLQPNLVWNSPVGSLVVLFGGDDSLAPAVHLGACPGSPPPMTSPDSDSKGFYRLTFA
ncbi:hypothetical protein STEG23_032042 [Scotinomys teguina]